MPRGLERRIARVQAEADRVAALDDAEREYVRFRATVVEAVRAGVRKAS